MTNRRAVHQTGSTKHSNTIFRMLVPEEGRIKGDVRLVQIEVEHLLVVGEHLVRIDLLDKIDFLLDIILEGLYKLTGILS